MTKTTPGKHVFRGSDAFTLIEVLVVAATVGIVILTLAPALAGTKYKTKTSMCAFNMRQWGAALSMYASDNHDFIPFYAESTFNTYSKVWYDYLAPYLGRANSTGAWINSTNNFSINSELSANEVRRCPAGNGNLSAEHIDQTWDTWVGVNFGRSGNTPLSGPFFYYDDGSGTVHPPLSITRIRKPADALGFMDARFTWVYSPVGSNWNFDYDSDGDGTYDSASSIGTGVPYNYAQPKVHENGANVTLLDGHVERVAFKDLWRVKSPFGGIVAHSFWYLDD
jgi:prepilin-type processing-associated H-X9-DG protein